MCMGERVRVHVHMCILLSLSSMYIRAVVMFPNTIAPVSPFICRLRERRRGEEEGSGGGRVRGGGRYGEREGVRKGREGRQEGGGRWRGRGGRE